MKFIEKEFSDPPRIYVPDPDHIGKYINVEELPSVSLNVGNWDWFREALGVEEPDLYDYDW